MTEKETERQFLAMLLLTAHKSNRNNLLSKKQDELGANNPMREVDAKMYTAFKAAAGANEAKYKEAVDTINKLFDETLNQNPTEFAECRGSYSGPDCPDMATTVAKVLV